MNMFIIIRQKDKHLDNKVRDFKNKIITKKQLKSECEKFFIFCNEITDQKMKNEDLQYLLNIVNIWKIFYEIEFNYHPVIRLNFKEE